MVYVYEYVYERKREKWARRGRRERVGLYDSIARATLISSSPDNIVTSVLCHGTWPLFASPSRLHYTNNRTGRTSTHPIKINEFPANSLVKHPLYARYYYSPFSFYSRYSTFLFSRLKSEMVTYCVTGVLGDRMKLTAKEETTKVDPTVFRFWERHYFPTAMADR